MHTIDFDVLLGRPKIPQPNVDGGLADLAGEMDRLDVRRAVVRHRACEEVGPETGNQQLLRELDGTDRCVPAWFVKPEGVPPRFDPAAEIRDVVARGVRAAWTAPTAVLVPLQPWIFERMLGALEAHRVPLVLRMNDVPPADLRDVAVAFPELPIVLVGVTRMGRHRVLYPLMEKCSNVHLCCSPPFAVHLGIEDLCRRFGSERVLFGTGFPNAEGGVTVAQVMYADVTDDDKANIAHRNAERLLGEVRHEPC